MICGVNYDDREKVRFNSVEYQMLNIIEWGEKSGYQLDKSFELRLSESGELTIQPVQQLKEIIISSRQKDLVFEQVYQLSITTRILVNKRAVLSSLPALLHR